MELQRINNTSATQVTLADGTCILFSYSTPVAACYGSDGPEHGFIRTSKRYSKTTSKHINQWLNGAKAREVDQSVIDKLAGVES